MEENSTSMNTKIKLVSLVAGVAIFAAACGGSAATSAPAASEAPAATEAPAVSEAPAMSEAPSQAAACPTDPLALTLWTKEGDPSLQYVKDLTTAYTAAHPNVTFEVVNKDVELLREDFQTSSLAGDAPEILWTVADHIGPFTAADLILPLNDMVDTASYDPTAAAIATVGDTLWGAPISFGNQLMLYWDKAAVGDTAPADSTAWVAKAKELTTGGNYGIVFNQTESFWLVPFLGGYDGSVFAADGVTPTLNTDAMKGALQFMYDLKYTDKVMPAEADYNVADGLFKDGKSPMIVNGDWALADYVTAKGDKLGVGPIPQIAGKSWPAPYVAGAFWMASKAVGDNPGLKCVVSDFFKWSTATDEQVNMVKVLKRLPGNAAALADPIVTGDPLWPALQPPPRRASRSRPTSRCAACSTP